MQTNNIIEYIKRNMLPEKQYKKSILMSGIITCMGLLFGFILGPLWVQLGMFMLIVFVICTVIVFNLMSKKLTLKRQLIVQTIIYANLCLQLGTLEAIIYTSEYGMDINMFLLYLPVIIIPIVLCITTSIMLKKKKKSNNKLGTIYAGIIGVISPLAGWRFSIIVNNSLSDNYTVPIILICLTIVNSAFSIGFLNIQKLYYLKKYDNTEMLSEVNLSKTN